MENGGEDSEKSASTGGSGWGSCMSERPTTGFTKVDSVRRGDQDL